MGRKKKKDMFLNASFQNMITIKKITTKKMLTLFAFDTFPSVCGVGCGAGVGGRQKLNLAILSAW